MQSTEKITDRLDLRLANGSWVTVNIGVPDGIPIGEGYTLFSPPLKPHVINVDRLIKEDPSDLKHPLSDEKDKTILYMHGKEIDGRWVPEDEELVAKNVTIPDIIAAYEAASGKFIDFAFVCSKDKVRGRVVEDHGQIVAAVETSRANG